MSKRNRERERERGRTRDDRLRERDTPRALMPLLPPSYVGPGGMDHDVDHRDDRRDAPVDRSRDEDRRRHLRAQIVANNPRCAIGLPGCSVVTTLVVDVPKTRGGTTGKASCVSCSERVRNGAIV